MGRSMVHWCLGHTSNVISAWDIFEVLTHVHNVQVTTHGMLALRLMQLCWFSTHLSKPSSSSSSDNFRPIDRISISMCALWTGMSTWRGTPSVWRSLCWKRIWKDIRLQEGSCRGELVVTRFGRECVESMARFRSQCKNDISTWPVAAYQCFSNGFMVKPLQDYLHRSLRCEQIHVQHMDSCITRFNTSTRTNSFQHIDSYITRFNTLTRT